MDLWSEKAGPRQPVDSSRGPTLAALAARDRKDRRRFLGAPALHASGALERRADRNDRAMPTKSRATSTCRCSTSMKRCSAACAAKRRARTSKISSRELRAGIPGVALRTTFIVGFPGETDGEFESLLEFIERTRFERLGIFKYSQEEGSRAAKMPDQIPATVKNARYPSRDDIAATNRARDRGGKGRTTAKTSRRSAIDCSD